MRADPDHSAQGTRLNRRGIESRRRFVHTAIATLAREGPASISANLVAKRAGFTWGAVQHLFGDADGVWAAVVDEMHDTVRDLDALGAAGAERSMRRRVADLVEFLWEGLDTPEARAVENLRLALPRDLDLLRRDWPKTLASFERLDAYWEELTRRSFAGLEVSGIRLRRARSLVPGAIRGLRMEADLLTFADPEEGRKALTAGMIAYLEGG